MNTMTATASPLLPLTQGSLEESLREAVRDLAVPPSKYDEARRSYDAVGKWLNDEPSPLARYQPEIFAQGSFALGTAIKPVGEDHHDVDAVCLLQIKSADTSQEKLKQLVGDRLREHGTYVKMIDPEEGGRRCWTLVYADGSQFHLDVLPAIPDDASWLEALGVPPQYAQHAVLITDRDTWASSELWPRSNPKGYAAWFHGRKQIAVTRLRKAEAMRIQCSVESVPERGVVTPLQQAIQLLKRHRDVRFPADPDKPISIIITTLAARAYENEDSVLGTLLAILPKMRASVERRGDRYWVPNPVNPAENFADRWEQSPRKAELFFKWLEEVEEEHRGLVRADSGRIRTVLKKAYSVPLTESAPPSMTRLVTSAGPASSTTSGAVHAAPPAPAAFASRAFNVKWRQPPRWHLQLSARVDIEGTWQRADGGWAQFASGAIHPKRRAVRFLARPSVAEPYEVHWQVVNTGNEATARGCLRGGFYGGGGRGEDRLRRGESTLYTGMHWVECFIVKNGVCVARSGEFVINIA